MKKEFVVKIESDNEKLDYRKLLDVMSKCIKNYESISIYENDKLVCGSGKLKQKQ
ncbi:hypothetical protein [Vallitalea guaymasensis]|uniref:hypothetical protein n=1 Tax=Vallitalea guaymasensis TaxID=1185412 RepID=UPI00187D30EE|nr:hypothetical protein [Vallitalea guaymasensis]